MSILQWRMPTGGEPPARLTDVTVAEVAEALEAPLPHQLRHSIDKDVLAIFSVTVERRVIGLLMIRNDDSFVWRVAVARPVSSAEFEIWLGRISDE